MILGHLTLHGNVVQAHLHRLVAAGAEGAAGGHVQKVDGVAGDGHQTLLHPLGAGDGAQQALGVLVAGVVEDLVGGAALAHTAAVHHDDLIAHGGDDAQVVGDHDDGHAQLFLQFLHQFQDLRLDGHVQSGGGLVGDEDVGLAGQGHGDHHALPHAAGQLIGILLHALGGLVHAHQGEHLDGAGLGLGALFVRVQTDGLFQLVADGEHRVQAGHGVLEDDGAALAPEARHLVAVPLGDVLALVLNAAAGDAAVVRQDLHDGIGGHRFAGARLTHDAQHLAGIQVEGNAVDRMHLAVVGGEGGVQVLDR